MLSVLKDFPALCIAALFLAGCAPSPPKEEFSKLAEEFIYTSLANSPSTATQVGYHRHGSIELDSMLDDFSPAALEKQRRWVSGPATATIPIGGR
jgi:hypothetical protein